MRLRNSTRLLRIFTLVTLVGGLGCAGVKPMATAGTAGTGGTGGVGLTGGTGPGGTGGTGPVPITPWSGNFTCTDFDTTGACPSFSTNAEPTFDNATTGSTSIAYPLDGSLFPANLGPIQIQMTTPGTAARISFHTVSSDNVDVNFFGSCDTAAPGTGCSVTIPIGFTRMLIPACQDEDIQITARVLSGGKPTGDSPAIKAAWTQAALTGGLYYWTVLPNQSYCPSATTVTPGTYCLQDTTQVPKNGTAIYRYDFAQDNPVPQQIWTDDGGPKSTTAYDGSPQSYVTATSQYGGHCIGCHTITNDGKYMGLTIGGSSTYNGANWELLDIAQQALEIINPTASTDPNSSPTSNPADYWKKYRKDALATEMAWGPKDDVMVSMFKAKLFLNTVAVSGTSATVTQTSLALPTSAAAIDPYQSDPFWSHDGSLLVYTSFNKPGPDTTGNPGGLNGDLKQGGQIAIADATAETVTDNARVLVHRDSTVSSYYPCVSEDNTFVVFNQSTCGAAQDFNAGAYGDGTCDGYDDSSAKLWWIPSAGGGSTLLNNANGGSANYDNSWPRFSPDVSTFRGKRLYWVAFSSRRPYGVQANTGVISATQPQLWFAGVAVAEVPIGDPSFAPVWLPGQNAMGNGTLYGNHVPQWVKVAITIDTGL